MLQQVMRYFFCRRENPGKSALHSAELFFLEKISRMPSAEMENFMAHTPGKALKILRRL